MCEPGLRNSRQARLANLCLAGGLLINLFAHPATLWGQNASHFAGGVLIGISIAMNLCVLRKRRSACRPSGVTSC